MTKGQIGMLISRLILTAENIFWQMSQFLFLLLSIDVLEWRVWINIFFSPISHFSYDAFTVTSCNKSSILNKFTRLPHVRILLFTISMIKLLRACFCWITGALSSFLLLSIPYFFPFYSINFQLIYIILLFNFNSFSFNSFLFSSSPFFSILFFSFPSLSVKKNMSLVRVISLKCTYDSTKKSGLSH
mgnify:CR=1 FL=1